MGDNTLATQITGTTITVDGVNQYKTALDGDLVPRNSAGSATDEAGSVGTDALKFLKAHIASGYWDIGDIKPHHSYNGSTPVGQGWYPCDGSVINETNYDTLHGAGAWDTYVGSSVLDGKYAPNMLGRYPVGAASTTQDGTSSITSVGNSSNQVNLQHNHSHNHQWYTSTASNANDTVFNSSGNAVAISPVSKDSSAYSAVPVTDTVINNRMPTAYTNNDSTNGGSSAQSIQPESIETIYYIRII